MQDGYVKQSKHHSSKKRNLWLNFLLIFAGRSGLGWRSGIGWRSGLGGRSARRSGLGGRSYGRSGLGWRSGLGGRSGVTGLVVVMKLK